jgi:hypothetical protein
MSDPNLERVRRACLAFPEATEKLAWGERTFRVRDRLFAMYANASNSHGKGRPAVWCHAPEGAQAALVQADPERFFVPPYLGKGGWIGIYLDRVTDDELALHACEAYCVVAPKQLQALLEQGPA